MKKILSLFLLLVTMACHELPNSTETYIQNTENEKIYLKAEGLQNAQYHKLAFIQHGLASNMDHQAVQAAKRAFLAHHYVVITFDARHSLGNSDNNVMAVSLDSFEEDLKTVIAWAEKQPYYQEPFALAGHSLGGAAVLQYSAKNPEKVGILIPITPVISGKLWEKSCMENMQDFCLKWKADGFYTYQDSKNHKIAMIPYNVVRKTANYDANDLTPTITANTLIIAAENDVVIATDDIQTVNNKIKNGHTVTIFASGHNFETPQNQSDLYNVIDNFLQ